jgi:hypothetical protein
VVNGEDVDFDMDDFIINLDNLRLLDFGDCKDVQFRINKNGIGKIELHSDNIELNYIATSLTN